MPFTREGLKNQQQLGAWVLDTAWTEILARVDVNKRGNKFVPIPNEAFRTLHQLSIVHWPKSPGDLRYEEDTSYVAQMTNAEAIGNVYEAPGDLLCDSRALGCHQVAAANSLRGVQWKG